MVDIFAGEKKNRQFEQRFGDERRMQGIQVEERAENRTMVTGYQPSDAQSSPGLAKLVSFKENTDPFPPIN
jgi:hypothetical protein